MIDQYIPAESKHVEHYEPENAARSVLPMTECPPTISEVCEHRTGNEPYRFGECILHTHAQQQHVAEEINCDRQRADDQEYQGFTFDHGINPLYEAPLSRSAD
ncbi:hypothetical protein BSLA_01f4939 [Burkholderia stabilis]|nr:hypothetical protein BSLA_01f4939 [Burkholderia stabilis]